MLQRQWYNSTVTAQRKLIFKASSMQNNSSISNEYLLQTLESLANKLCSSTRFKPLSAHWSKPEWAALIKRNLYSGSNLWLFEPFWIKFDFTVVSDTVATECIRPQLVKDQVIVFKFNICKGGNVCYANNLINNYKKRLNKVLYISGNYGLLCYNIFTMITDRL